MHKSFPAQAINNCVQSSTNYDNGGPCYILLMEQQELIEKIKRLPHDRVAEVEAFIDSLSREQSLDRTALHQALTDYALQHAETNADLDPDLEAAAVEHMLEPD